MARPKKPTRRSKPEPEPEEDHRIVGYARVSTGEQRLDLQLDALRKAGVMEDNLHTDNDVSGMRRNRPGLERAMMDARRGDTLVVWKLDRLGRDPKNLLDLIERLRSEGVVFRSLTENIDTSTPSGRMLFMMTAAFAQFERDMVSERTKAGMASSMQAGVVMGAPRKISDKMVAEAKRLIARGSSVASAAQQIATKYKVKLSANGLRYYLQGGVAAIRRTTKR